MCKGRAVTALAPRRTVVYYLFVITLFVGEEIYIHYETLLPQTLKNLEQKFENTGHIVAMPHVCIVSSSMTEL
jgi:hypothetical protein